MFEQVTVNNQMMGHLLKFKDGFCFFGSKNLTKENLHELFPGIRFYFLKQVHGACVIPASPKVKEADGHWTDQNDQALVIQTADCIPLMIRCNSGVYALHAGWRGVEQNILRSALTTFPPTGPLHGIIGPHIHKESFEVGTDVAERLVLSDPKKDHSLLHAHSDPTKSYVDLKEILRHQLSDIASSENMDILDINTFKSPNHFSYRKRGPQAGRLLSFIVRTQHFPKFETSETITL